MNNIYIFGFSGQDGKISFEVLSRKYKKSSFFLFNKDLLIIKKFNSIDKKINLSSNFEYINLISNLFQKFNPSLIFYFAAVHFSFEEKSLNQEKNKQEFTNYLLPIHILSECALLNKKTKFLYTSSSLIFSGSKIYPQDEMTERVPTCDYSNQKVMTEKILKSLGNKLGIDVYIAILYNHESIYRKEKFFTKKIISFLSKYKKQRINAKQDKILLYNKDSLIDMGYALDFVNGMVNLVLEGKPDSYIFSTQKPIKVKHFVDVVLEFYQLPISLVEFKESPSRSLYPLIGKNKKIFDEIGWKPEFYGEKLAKKLCNDFEKFNLI
tara:strand:+ start:178 stop:1146 length:969 start_codon:yes stop_codon:yes gene_type:complete